MHQSATGNPSQNLMSQCNNQAFYNSVKVNNNSVSSHYNYYGVADIPSPVLSNSQSQLFNLGYQVMVF